MHKLLLALAIAFTLAFGASCAHHTHVHNDSGGQPKGISVSGSGEAKAKPDIARTSLGVEARAATVEQATADANQRMAAVVAALKQLGIADSDLRTHSYSVGFEQDHTPVPPTPAPPARGAVAAAGSKDKAVAEVATLEPTPVVRGHYRVSNMLEVTIRDLTRVGQVLSRATESGANNVWGISFDLEDPFALKAQARAQAMARAQQSAAALAQLAGVKLGGVVSVSESDGGYMPMMKSARAEMASSADVPVEQGEITVQHQVQVTYATE